MGEARRIWYCTTIDVPASEVGDKEIAASTAWHKRERASATALIPMGVAAKHELWCRDTVLKVRFLHGTQHLHERVMNTAQSWFLDGVRLTLRHVQEGERADLRVAFEAQGGSWSYVGTDCLTVQPTQPTMNLGWATSDTPEVDFSSVVLHEFGHALGLLHEHVHPEARIQWDEAAVRADLGGEPNYWDKDTIDRNVFAQFDPSVMIVHNFNESSVMMYPIAEQWTVNKKSYMPSWKLNEVDKATIRGLYG